MAAFRIEAMSLRQLIDFDAKLKSAIIVARARERAAAKQALFEVAQMRGFSLQELTRGTRAPKYINPDNPEQTWTGRGRKPNWLLEKLDGGARMDEFSID